MSEPNLESPFLKGMATFKQFAKDVDKSERTVERWAAQGLPVFKRGRLRLIDIEQGRAWLRGEPKPGAKRRRAA
jgi:phage terminase Nu1 subunit (DNA packaging protein)